jgi:Fibronectin type III-like domain
MLNHKTRMNPRKAIPMCRKVFLLILAVCVFQLATAQEPSSSSPEVEKRVDSILAKMTLEEKIDYIGGFEDFYVRAIPRLGVRAVKMSDGPTGVRNRRAFSYYDVEGKDWKAEPGEFTILIGGSSDSTPLKGTFAFIQ